MSNHWLVMVISLEICAQYEDLFVHFGLEEIYQVVLQEIAQVDDLQMLETFQFP